VNAITIRKLSESAMTQIERLAALHQRSVEDEAAALIEQGLKAPLGPTEAYLLAERIAAMTPKGVKQTDSVELLREDRDR
jgi:antitoxin FitA